MIPSHYKRLLGWYVDCIPGVMFYYLLACHNILTCFDCHFQQYISFQVISQYHSVKFHKPLKLSEFWLLNYAVGILTASGYPPTGVWTLLVYMTM